MDNRKLICREKKRGLRTEPNFQRSDERTARINKAGGGEGDRELERTPGQDKILEVR